MPRVKRLRVRVPASTSNLGPGFDLLGLTLSLFLEVEARPGTGNGPHRITPGGGQAAAWPVADNLLARAFDAVFRAAGQAAPPQSFHATSQIPIARGLGSSGAAVAAGLLLGEARLHESGSEGLGLSALHELGIALEGHPDNVTASLFGGCTLCLPKSDEARGAHATALVPWPIAPSLGFAVVWGDATLATARAREVLPTSVPFADAVENPRRLAMLLAGLQQGEQQLLAIGAHDRLHHEARLALIPGGAETLAAAEAAGAWMTAINGSGSSLLAIGPRERAAEFATLLGATLDRFDTHVVAHALEVVHGTPQVEAAPDADRAARRP